MYVRLQSETLIEAGKLTAGTVEAHAAARGAEDGEPLLLIMDGMVRYAKAHCSEYDQKIAADPVLGHAFGDVIAGCRAMLNYQGAVALERGYSTDSKSNGMIEALYWRACEIAGLDGDEL